MKNYFDLAAKEFLAKKSPDKSELFLTKQTI